MGRIRVGLLPAAMLVTLLLCALTGCGKDSSGASLSPGQAELSAPADTAAHSASATYSVSGRARTPGGAGMPAVRLTFSGGAGYVTTDNSGYYIKNGLNNGTYNVIPSKANWVFTPPLKTITVSNGSLTGINFEGRPAYSICGWVRSPDLQGLPGVQVEFRRNGAQVGVATTDAAGWYQRSGFINGEYTVTPSLGGWPFAPVSRTLEIYYGDARNVNFHGFVNYVVAGRVRTAYYTGVAGVDVTFEPGGGVARTNADGYYRRYNVAPGTYTLTPSKDGLELSPESKEITVAAADLAGINFVGEARGDWSMFGRDPGHSHRSPYTGAQDNTLRWSYATGSSISSSPALALDGTLYIGSSDSKLYAVNPDGTQKWFVDSTHSFESSPAVGPCGTVYCGCADGIVYAINADGSYKWVFSTGSLVNSSPVVGTDGTVYVGCHNGNLYALYPNGTQKWSYTTGSYILSCPALGADGAVYVSSCDNSLYALEPDGTLRWSYATGDDLVSSPAIAADGTVYVGSLDNKLYAINPDGTLQWSYTAGWKIYTSPALAGDGTIYFGCDDGKLYALDPAGTQDWTYNTGTSMFDSAVAVGADGTLYFGGYDLKFHALNPDGSVKWEYIAGTNFSSSPAIGDDGTVYIGSQNGNVLAFGSET